MKLNVIFFNAHTNSFEVKAEVEVEDKTKDKSHKIKGESVER